MNPSNPIPQLPKVLCVDDKQQNRLVLKTILADMSVQVIEAASGEEALHLTLRHEFVCILMDVKMPGMDGIETANLMGDHPQTEQIPIIFVTGYSADEFEQIKGYSAGAIDFIIKPINPYILKSKLNLFLKMYVQSQELKQRYEEKIYLEQELKEKNLELENKNQLLESTNRERQRQYEQTRHLLELNPDGMLVIDEQKQVLYSNPAAARLLKQEASQLNQQTFAVPLSEDHGTEFMMGKDNVTQLKCVSIDWNGQQAYLISLHDITTLKQNEAKLFHLAKYDSLTGLANRAHCLDFLNQAIKRAKRRKGFVGVIFLDLDKFKPINDNLGHDQGDEILKTVAKRLEGCIRACDLAARLGGDEFTIILDQITQPQDAAIVAENIISQLAMPFQLKKHQLQKSTINVGCSIGIAIYPHCGGDSDTLFRSADIAMFHAKSSGSNRYQFFDQELQQSFDDPFKLKNDLDEAI